MAISLAGQRLILVLLGLSVVASASAVEQDVSEAQKAPFRRPATIPFPKDNPYTAEKAALGKMLFFDTRLSRDKNLNCASCHNPSFGWEVPFPRAIGAGGKPLGRHSPTVLNQAWSRNLFWDGRADSLEAQARGPIEADVEMDLPLRTAVTRLQALAGYRLAFDRAFPKEGLSETTVLKALATYERTLVTGDTPFDRWIRGDASALTDAARRGFALFTGKANCAACHSGWNFTDDKFHDIGLATQDEGRKGISGSTADIYAFKTPSLREIAARAPYMHNGETASLEAVVVHYIAGGIRRASLSPHMKPLALGAGDIGDLVEFMRSLSSHQTVVAMPSLPSH